MDKSEIIEGNKVIAKFLNLNDGWSFHKDDEERFNYPYSLVNPKGYTKFYDDWNCLMDVVEKIETLEENDRQKNPDKTKSVCTPYRIDILGRNVVEVIAFGEDSIFLINKDGLTKREAVYRAVVEFIKWYNKTQLK